jgi:hypothetical protein
MERDESGSFSKRLVFQFKNGINRSFTLEVVRSEMGVDDSSHRSKETQLRKGL